MKKQIVLNIFSNYAARFLSLALGFVLMPFLSIKLGIEALGMIVFFESLMQFLEIASESVRIALSRHAAFILSKGDRDELSSYLSAGRLILYAISAVILLAGLPFSFFVPDLFQVPAGQEDQCRILFAVMIFTFALRVPNSVYRSGLYAQQRYDLINLVISSASIVRAVVILALFSWLPPEYISLFVYGVTYFAATLAQNIFFSVSFRRLLPGIRLRLTGLDGKKMKEILSFGFYTAISHASSAAHENVIIVMINIFWGPAYNALYAIGMKFANLLESLFKEPIWALTPTFTALAAKEDKGRVEELMFIFTKALTLIAVPICLFLMFYAEWVILSWVGPEFRPTVILMIVSVFPLTLSIPLSVCENFPNAYGKVKLPSAVNTAFVAVSLGLGYILAVPARMGMPGVAWGTSITTGLYCVFYLAAYACHLSGISLKKYWIQAYLKPCLWACVYWAAVFSAARWIEPSPLALASVAFFAVLTFLYGAGSYQWMLDRSERSRLIEVWEMVPGIRPRPAGR